MRRSSPARRCSRRSACSRTTRIARTSTCTSCCSASPSCASGSRRRPQIDQRMSLRFHVDPMEADEVRGVRAPPPATSPARARAPIFGDDALATLAERSAGVPRVINTLATQALFVGAMRGLKSLDAALVGDVADDQHEEEAEDQLQRAGAAGAGARAAGRARGAEVPGPAPERRSRRAEGGSQRRCQPARRAQRRSCLTPPRPRREDAAAAVSSPIDVARRCA